MTQKYQLYVISHTHWDREWYGSFQLFRLRLVRLMNKLLALLEIDPEYKSFNLDGQTIILEDYLEVHPEKRETLIKHIKDGRLMVGPWYILPDEFLTGAESIVRNLLLGDRMAQEFGHRMEVGYIPDTFGHIAQLPQILQGFDLDNCMNFRGLDSGGRKSEIWWESPDGTKVLLHHMSTEIGYCDLGAMAKNPQRAAYDLRATAYYKAERSTGEILLAMQGVDHAEAREDLTMIVGVANDTLEDVEVIHGSLENFWSALKKSVEGKDLETVHGELRDVPRAEYSMNILLYNVLSSRVDNKLMNARTLLSLENWAEPWCTFGAMWDIADYPHGHLWTAWKWLLKNHPHDSIGGCSADEIHRQMMTRFEWAKEIADYLAEERFRLIAEQVNFTGGADDEIAVMVFNGTPFERDEVITVDIDLPEHWLRRIAIARQGKLPELTMDSHYYDVKEINTREDWQHGMPIMPDTFFRSIHVRSPEGDSQPIEIHDRQSTTTAIALASGPRGVLDIERLRVSFRARVPAFGYATYYVKTDTRPLLWKAPQPAPNTIQNKHINVVVHPNGTFDLRAKDDDWAYTYHGLGLFEDSGDNGDGYTFSPPPFNRVLTTAGGSPRISHVGTQVTQQHIRIEYDFEVPAGLDQTRQRRRDDYVICPITVDLILRQGSKRLEIGVTIENHAKDHRIRMRFPTGFKDVTQASSAMQFDVMTRPIQPEPIKPGDWWVEDPADSFPMHGWMDVSDPAGANGLGVIAEGMYEFNVQPQPDSADVNLTLLRAVGYLGARRDPTTIIGGAGPGIPTPEAQLQQTLRYRLALYPHAGDWESAGIAYQAQAFLAPPRAITIVPHEGTVPQQQTGLIFDSEKAVLSSVKQSEDGQFAIVRLYNPTTSPAQGQLTFPAKIAAAYATNLRETNDTPLRIADQHHVHVTIPPKRIYSVKVTFKK